MTEPEEKARMVTKQTITHKVRPCRPGVEAQHQDPVQIWLDDAVANGCQTLSANNLGVWFPRFVNERHFRQVWGSWTASSRQKFDIQILPSRN